MRGLVWWLYHDLKAYQLIQHQAGEGRLARPVRWDLPAPKPASPSLDRLLARLHTNKAELLMVLDRPEIPLHTNGSENDIRRQVTKL